ncbi:MAG: hypothetical protein ABFC77_00610 [Thermoguttaceae bacterium]
MVGSLRTEAFFQRLKTEHQDWLSTFHPQYRTNWEKLINADEEAALAEARIRQLLQGHGIAVEPNEDLTGAMPSPDFRCNVDHYKFYVEVTCIPIAVAAEKTGIPYEPPESFLIRPLNDAVFAKCCEKAPQCKNLDAPALVAIGTFHEAAATCTFTKKQLNWILTGEPKIGQMINSKTGKLGDTRRITKLQNTTFLDPHRENWLARRSISGVLLCGLAPEDSLAIGALHPNPARPFDPAILPQVEFAQVVVNQTSRQLRVDWPKENDEYAA